jgi:hypothetical protein
VLRHGRGDGEDQIKFDEHASGPRGRCFPEKIPAEQWVDARDSADRASAVSNPDGRHRMIDEKKILEILNSCWSAETSSKWKEPNPAAGQCSVTALVIQDRFGGRLLKTKAGDAWHFYNEIGGRVYDFTSSQFYGGILYAHEPADRSEALADVTPEQYGILSERFSGRFPP